TPTRDGRITRWLLRGRVVGHRARDDQRNATRGERDPQSLRKVHESSRSEDCRGGLRSSLLGPRGARGVVDPPSLGPRRRSPFSTEVLRLGALTTRIRGTIVLP